MEAAIRLRKASDKSNKSGPRMIAAADVAFHPLPPVRIRRGQVSQAFARTFCFLPTNQFSFLIFTAAGKYGAPSQAAKSLW